MNGELTQLAAAIAALQSRPAWAAGSEECAELVAGAGVAITQLTALQAVHARELAARDFPATQGATSLAVWLRDRARISIHSARRLVRLGEHLDAREPVAAAMATGVVTVEQAEVIREAIADLPRDLGVSLRDSCESALIGHAGVLEPAALRVIGDRILDHVAPEVAEAALLAKLDRDDRNAHEARGFTMTPHGHGIVRISGSLDTESAAIIRAAIEPLCTPLRTAGPSPAHDGPRTAARRRADALVEVCALALHSGDLPTHGATRPQLTVTFPLDPLTHAVGAGTLDTGETLSPATVRRLACDATIIPAVLGSHSEILDLGRSRRLYTGPARHALTLRDRGCTFPGCDRPPRWTEAHHIVSWLDGGHTDHTNGVLLCRRHHRAVHHDGWDARLNGHIPEFIPPAYVDPPQRPLRNHRFHTRT